jgi:hypothetical protein
MAKRGRFRGPADVLKLERLAAKTRRGIYASLAISMLLLGSFFAFLLLSSEEKKAARPPVVDFVVRTPRLTKPFELKKKRVPKRTMTRKVAAAEPKILRTITERIDRPQVFGTVESFSFAVESGARISGEAVEPKIPSAVRLTSSKEPEKRISMQEEFVDLFALDTGKYKGLVVQDPADKKNIKGFVYLGLAVGEELDPPTPRAIPQLVEAINKFTLINAKVEERLPLDSRDIFKAPFVYITEAKGFNLTEHEARNLENYLRSGGFVLAENSTARLEYGPAEASLRKMFKDVLGKDARFQILPDDHPIYHSFFDFNNGPPSGDEIYGDRNRQGVPSPHLEGIYLNGRLVAIYSDKAYGLLWQRECQNEPQLKMGVNLVVYALTQEGSIAQQQIDLYSDKR